ncbi:hypothetical protein [Actinomycetospora chibensis]|uniref:DoxX family protein n=1 Tax=Actinomycetospora chibensis TaxID=663606 RepID=A0ABV9RGB0_9PSEU|nr:hypothetical protein [Actinomycetospora chibensis]MDD7927636.1 hypothetical protein [Actinomycetospora chibensis]
MENNVLFIGLWLACGAATVAAAAPAHRSRTALIVGRVAVGVLFIVGGALLHVINLVSGATYSGFADPAFFPWVTAAWQAVVVPNAVLFIGLLALFEAAVGILALSGARATQIGYVGVIAFCLLLWLFGWMELVWVVVMIVPMLVLLRAEHRDAFAAAASTSPPRVGA